MFRITIPLLILFLLINSILPAQTNQENSREVEIRRIEASIKIDGVIDSLWSNAMMTTDFNNHRPSDIGKAESQTEVKLLYNRQFVYILAKAYQKEGTQVIQNLKRDNYFDNDGFAVIIDPINKQTNGFFFGVNSRGSQAESLVIADGNTNWNWDAKWYANTKSYQGYWVAEIAIPFYTLRYDSDIKTWGINFIRNDLHNNMYSSWTAFSINFNLLDLGYTGVLKWTDEIPKVKKRLAVIPSITTTVGRDFEEGEAFETDFTPSLDMKVALSSSLNLDLTVNPDFSQIEVDRQVTNLSRFNLFFPERRTFFLENSDLFTSFGRGNINPFFSRTIGLRDGQNIPIRFGARLTGNAIKSFAWVL